jgi:threonine-phosphate decarboxylase
MAVVPLAASHGGDIFAVSRAYGWDWREVLDFSANINPLGPSPRVSTAIVAAIERIVHYPEREPARLVSTLARTWGLGEAQLVVGNGATELIFFLARVSGSTPVTLALPVFSEFHRAFPGARLADLTDPSTWPADGLLVLTRPANPSGWTLPAETLRNYLDSSTASVLVDESFLEFSGLSSVAALIGAHPKLMVLRSLTKFYALPGIRVGALIGSPEAVCQWKEHREPWQVNVLAEEAALAAINDTNHALHSVDFVRNERVWLEAHLRCLPNVDPIPSDANFISVRINYSAKALCAYLLSSKILIRNCVGWPGVTGELVRLAVRRRDENEQLLNVWREFKCD